MVALHGTGRRTGGEERQEKREGGRSGVACRDSPGRLLDLERQAGRGVAIGPAQDTHEMAAYWKKMEEGFAENPLGFGRFQGEIKTAHFCKIL
jgi:hypothetical protein